MNKTISLAAIAMFAVIMGMGAFAPAVLADKPTEVRLCHWGDGLDEIDPADDAWEVITVNSNGHLNGHMDRHTDGTDFDVVLASDGSEDDSVCLARNA